MPQQAPEARKCVEPLHHRCMEGVADVIRGVTLLKVFMQFLPDEKELPFPVILVSVEGTTELELEGNFEEEEVEYPVNVFFADKMAADDQERLAEVLVQRRLVAREFRSRAKLP